MFDPQSQQLKSLGWLLHGAGTLPTLVIGTVFWFGYAVPLNAEKKIVRAEIKHTADRLADGLGIREEHQTLQEQVAANQQKIDRVRQRIPDRAEEAEFLRLVTDASDHSGLEIGSYSRGKESDEPEFSQLDINIQARGSFESICRFLDCMEQIPRVAKVTSLQLHGQDKSTEGGYPLTITVRLYYAVHVTASQTKGAHHG